MNLADAIVPSAAAEVAVLDSAGIVVWVNDPWTRFAQDNGAPPGWTGVGSSYLDICDTAGDPPSLAVARALRAALRGELAGWAAIEVPCHSPTEDRWFDIVIGPRFDDSGRSVGASVTIARLSRHDAPRLQRPPAAITETPPARQPTASSQPGWSCTAEDYPDPLLAVDADGRVVAANQALCQLFGLPPDRVVGGSLEQLVPAGSRGMHRQLRAGYLNAPRRRQMGGPAQVLAGQHADGHTFSVGVSLAPAELAGRPVALAAVRDLSEQVDTDSRTRLVADLLDVTADAIVVHAAEDLRPVWANRTMADLTGYPVRELMTDPAASSALGLAAIGEAAQGLLDGSAAEVHFNTTMINRDGRRLPVDVQLVYRERSPGEGYLVAVRRDMSEQEGVRAERERRAALIAAASEVRLAVLSGRSTRDCLNVVCQRAAELVGIRSAAIWMPSRLAGQVALVAFSGRPSSADRIGRTAPVAGSVEDALLHGDVVSFEPDTDQGDLFGRDTEPCSGTPEPGGGVSVPLVADGRVFGVMTLTWEDDRLVDPDERARLAEFGTQVGVALAFGQLRRDHDREAAIVAASAEILLAVLSSRPMAECLELICERARSLLDADAATVLTPTPDGRRLLSVATAGTAARTPTGAIERTAWQTIRTGDPTVGPADGDTPGPPPPPTSGDPGVQQPTDQQLAAPLRAGTGRLGALVVARAGHDRFSHHQVQTLTTFASYAATTLEVGRLRADRERLARLEERERIARDLHDSVIQDLFAGGLRLSSALKFVHDPAGQQRVHEAVAVMDAAIAQLRATIFRITEPDQLLSVRMLLDSATDSRTPQLGYQPQLHIAGDPEILPSHVVTELIQIITEALSNTARHADSSVAQIHLDVGPHGRWELEIHDNGIGFDPDATARGHGLANIATRAGLLGATLSIRSAQGGGTSVLLRSSPLPPGPDATD